MIQFSLNAQQLFSLLLISSTLALIYFLVLQWFHKGARYTIAPLCLTLCSFGWSSCLLFETISSNRDIQHIWEKGQLASLVLLPLAWFIFTNQSRGIPAWLNLRSLILLLVLPTITFLLMLTNHWHQLIWSDVWSPSSAEQFWSMSYGPWIVVYTLFATGLLMLSCLALFRQAAQVVRLAILPAAALIVGAVGSGLAIILFLMLRHPLGLIDPTPLVFVASYLLVGWGFSFSYARSIIGSAYAVTFDKLNDGVIVLDARQRIVDLNQVAAEIFGIAPAAVLGWPVDQVLTLESGQFPQSLYLQNNTQYSVSTVPLWSPSNNLLGEIILVRDETIAQQSREQQQVYDAINALLASTTLDQKVLRQVGHFFVQSQADFCLIIIAESAHTPPSLSLTFADQTYQALSEACDQQGFFVQRTPPEIFRLLQMERPDLLWQLPAEALALLSTDDRHPTLIKALAEGRLLRESLVVAGSTLGMIVLGTLNAPLRDQSRLKSLAATLALAVHNSFCSDTLRATELVAYKAAQDRSEFLANLSHEIRTAINAVISATELVQRTTLDAEQTGLMKIIGSSSSLLLDIVNNTLDLSKIEAGQLNLQATSFCIRTCIEDSLQIFAPRIGTHQVELSYIFDSSVPEWLVADPVRIRQILVNLISNAVKFTDQGEITISVTAQPLADAQLEVQVAVSDTGIGITPEGMARLFTPFSQLHTQRAHQESGIGLGLVISKRLSELMGGRMWVVSKPSYGSTFTFSFVAVLPPNPLDTPLSRVQPQLSGKQILIVGQHTTAMHILGLQIQAWGMQVYHVTSHAEALERIHSLQPLDLMLITLSARSNHDLIRALIQSFRSFSNQPIVRLAWFGEPEIDDGFIQSMLYTTLYRPVVRDVIYRTLLDALEGRPAGLPVLSTSADPAHPRTLHILVADDDVTNQLLTLNYVMLLNHRVDIVDDGPAVLRLLNQQTYDIVLLDLMMPGMDGIEVTQLIRQMDSAAQQTYIIGVTASTMPGDRERCFEAGMNDYLSKPMRLDDLSQAIQRFFQYTPVATRLAQPDKYRQNANRHESLGAAPSLPQQSNDLRSATLMASLATLYLRDATDLIDRLQAALEAGDASSLITIAHKLKSSSAIVNANRLAMLLNQVELQLRRSSPGELPPDLEADINAIIAEFELVRQALTSKESTDLTASPTRRAFTRIRKVR